ncbi:MAG: hypothetical protein COU43_02610 [Candidatus Nealsonbacteria bacterium CG10_big_fil_rev_8_21_14_0_10_37_25]|uniref:Uncharacterized protein n=1 Tax=Candidatus Nealsonbacteria bacterium CG10_big_fil_rev_8_21_14_0_10_37_25 TaxID=1974711 RepID=A0A2H0TKD9_9BACT|nr:MAG: hypothetical protein COU43_02610 [Candidatus Nealsonbacteria bacterium CG10_big_fil_rev_8_21_14_0_10_37_25]
MEKIVYSSHLILRLKLRKIPYNLPKIICQTSKEHYFDKETFKKIAVKKVKFKNKLRGMAVVYNQGDGKNYEKIKFKKNNKLRFQK